MSFPNLQCNIGRRSAISKHVNSVNRSLVPETGGNCGIDTLTNP